MDRLLVAGGIKPHCYCESTRPPILIIILYVPIMGQVLGAPNYAANGLFMGSKKPRGHRPTGLLGAQA